MDYQIAYLNVYGNAGVLADELQTILAGAEMVDLSGNQEISYSSDVYLLVFEITRDAIPLKIMDVLENLEGKTVLCIVTCSMALLESKDSVEQTCSPFCRTNATIAGYFSAQVRFRPVSWTRFKPPWTKTRKTRGPRSCWRHSSTP